MFDFIKNNFKTILKICFVIFILYWIILDLNPNSQISADQKAMLDSLSIKI